MKPSSEEVEGSGEDTLIGITIEDMVSTVEMLEWLEVGRKETERAHATSFFSRHLDYYGPLRGRFRHMWAEHLPNLVPLLADCLLTHNSKAVQSHAILSIIYLLGSSYKITDEIVNNSAVPQLFFGLGAESDCPEILELLGRIFADAIFGSQRSKPIDPECLSFVTDRICNYAAILEPTETEADYLATAIKAFHPLCYRAIGAFQPHSEVWLQRKELVSKVLPSIVSIFKEPEKRKWAQMQAMGCIEQVGSWLPATLLESGILKVLVENVRTGMENYPAFDYYLKGYPWYRPHRVLYQGMLDAGGLDAFLQMFKHPEHMSWSQVERAHRYIEGMWKKNADGHRDAILNHPGLVEQFLELVLAGEKKGRDLDYYRDIECSVTWLLDLMTRTSSNQHRRRLMIKESFLRVLGLYLSPSYRQFNQLGCQLIRPCLEAFEMPQELRLRHRLFNGTGVTDALRSLADTANPDSADARDTYFKDPIPLPAPSNLPSLIHTDNYPY